jgi:hypothetical protein
MRDSLHKEEKGVREKERKKKDKKQEREREREIYI